jgi:hypothetical protein
MFGDVLTFGNVLFTISLLTAAWIILFY